MPEIRTINLRSRRARKQVLLFPHRLYAGDPNWVPPRFHEQMRTLDPRTGEFFTHGYGECFGAFENGTLRGTVCVAEDEYKNRITGLKDCIFGFFEYENDTAVFNALMNRAVSWAREHGLSRLIGPFNLDYENNYGLVVEGEDRLPTMLCAYTKDYYLEHMRRWNFSEDRGRNLAFELDLSRPNGEMEKLFRLGDRLVSRSDLRVRGADFSDFENEVERIYYLINKSLAHIPDFKPWHREDLAKTLKEFKSFADPELILFAEIPRGSALSRNPENQPLIGGWEPVGWLPGLPNLNEYLVHTGGLRFPWQFIQLLALMRRQPRCLTIKSVLIPPEYWAKGVSIGLFSRMFQTAISRGYSWVDFSLTSEKNPYTPDLARRMGARMYRAYQVFTLEI